MATCDVIYGSYNYVDQSETDIVGGSENAFYPASNLKEPRSTKVYRSTIASDNVVFDFKSAVDIDLICVRPDLDDGWGFDNNLTIEANTIDSWAAPAYTSTLTVDHSYNFAASILAATETYRFWRISGTASSYFELSNIFIGAKFQAERNASLNWNYYNNDLSKQRENEDGQVFIDVRPQRKEIDYNIKVLTKSGFALLESELDYLGKIKPLWLIMDNEEKFSNAYETFSGMFYVTRKSKYRNPAFGYYDTSLVLKEGR